MGVRPEDIQRAIDGGNRVLAQLRRVCPTPEELARMEPPKPKKRIRQSSKPLSNKLEAECGHYLREKFPHAGVYEQAITLRLGNGVKYTPDWVVVSALQTTVYEVKGKKVWDDSVAKLKVAASLYHFWEWYLIWKDKDGWQTQVVLP